MPSDIRAFFGGKPSAAPAPKIKEEPKKRGRKKVISDDEEEIVKPSPKKAGKKQPAFEPVVEETTADDFFGKGTKPKRTEVVKKKPAPREASPQTNGKSRASKKSTGSAAQLPRGRAKKDVSYVEVGEDEFPDDDMVEDTDNFKADAMVGKRMGDDYQEATDDEDDKPLVPAKRVTGRNTKVKKEEEEDFEPNGDVDMKDDEPNDVMDLDDEEEVVEKKPAKGTSAKASRKRKADEDDDDLEVEETKPKKRATPVKKAAASKKLPKEEVQDSAEMRQIFDSIPTIKAPEPPPKSKDGEKAKFVYGQHGNSAVPAGALDYSDLPQGQDNCLAGLVFVFTGQLQRLGREQGQGLVKQYGGKVTGAPSKKTSYVILGEDAGPKKLETIKQYGLKVINEEGLFELIKRLPANGGDSAAAALQAEKRAKEDEKIREAAMEMEREEKARKAAAAKAAKVKLESGGVQPVSSNKGKANVEGPDNRLWTVRYAPTQLTQICGNKAQVEKLQRWLRAFPKNQRIGFKMGGPDGSGLHRAVMIHGPPGIGKTTAAHLVAKLEGYDVVESNASDTRSKKLVESGLKGVLSTTSLMGYFAADGEKADAAKKKLVLIMDEVDGMSAGDRGGVGALAAVCKKTQVPMILICNERKQPKMKPFDFVTYDLGFRRPTTDMIRSRISTIAFREGLKMPTNVINALIEGTGADIRQVVNMISTAKLDQQNMSFEESKDMSKAWEKHIVLKPWAMVEAILGKGLFNPASKSTLNDKQEIYFNDHDFGPLMLQENYLGTKPQRANKYDGNAKLQALARLDLASKAADSISDGDLVDRMIHGSQQQWSLMPTHAMLSFVRPASFVYGTLAGNQTRFTTWLGNNSKGGKLMRYVKDIQGHMRLRVSADRYEVRQTYLPLLFEKLIRRLEKEGKEAVPDIIELMDSYFLTKDDWDAILELGVGDDDSETIKIETQAKSTFTRIYNQQAHPLPFIKSSQVVAPKRAPPKERPDLEEALEESGDEALDDADVKEESDHEADLAKDKYVAKPKKKKAAAPKKKGKAAESDGEEEEKPKKAKGKAKAKK